MSNSLFSYDTLVHAVAGSMASVFAMTTTFPLDSIRARIQLDRLDPSKTSTLRLLLQLLQEDAAKLYKGLTPTLQSLCASNFVYFYVFHGIKRNLKQTSPLKNLLIGTVAGIVNVLTTTPLWVVNTRIRMGKEGGGLGATLLRIFRTEGPRSLWAGTLPSLLLAINPALQFMSYEALKKKFKGGALLYFLLGAISKCIATVATYPLQIVQHQMRHGGKSFREIISQILSTHGPLGLYKGMEAKLYQTVLTAALMFAFYEKIAHSVFSLMGRKVSVAK